MRVSGCNLEVDSLLALVQIVPDRVWRRGEPRVKSNANDKFQHSGATFVASDADLYDFDLQVECATEFLKEHSGDISTIIAFKGVEDTVLDFGIGLRDTAIHCDILTPQFLKAAGDAGVIVELSHYPRSSEKG